MATADWMFTDVEEVRDAVMGKGQYWTDDQKLASDTEDDLNNELNKLRKNKWLTTRPILLHLPKVDNKKHPFKTIHEALYALTNYIHKHSGTGLAADWMYSDLEELNDELKVREYFPSESKSIEETIKELKDELKKLKKMMGRTTRPVLLRVPADSSKHTAYETIEEAIEHLQDISSEEIPSDTTTDYVSAPREIAIPSTSYVPAPTSYVPGPTSYVRDGAPTTYVAPTTYARDIAIPSTRYVSTTYV